MNRWQLLITNFPEVPCYNMSPTEAWELPFDQFRDLSDGMKEMIRRWRSS